MASTLDRQKIAEVGEKAARAATLYCLLTVGWENGPAPAGRVRGSPRADGRARTRGSARRADRHAARSRSAPALEAHARPAPRSVGLDRGGDGGLDRDEPLPAPAAPALRGRRHATSGFRRRSPPACPQLQGERAGILDLPASGAGTLSRKRTTRTTWACCSTSVGPTGRGGSARGLEHIAPAIYEVAQSRQLASLAAALSLNEEMLLGNLFDLTGSLLSQINGKGDGTAPRIYEASLDALQTFLARFSEVVLWGADEIEDVVGALADATGGLRIEDLRANLTKRLDLSGAVKARERVGELAMDALRSE